MKNRTKIDNGQDFDFLKLRKRYGLTQADLGQLLKVSKNYICQIETGRKVPSETLTALAQRIEQELEAEAPLHEASNSPGEVSKKIAFEHLEKVWAAAEGDKNLQGYIVTKLKLVFPLDRLPFSKENGPR